MANGGMVKDSRGSQQLSVRIVLLRELAKVFLFSYLLFFAIDIAFPGFVSGYLNMSFLLLPAIVFGVFAVAFGKFGDSTRRLEMQSNDSTRKWVAFMIFIALLTFFAIWVSIRYIGPLSFFIAGVAAIIVVFLQYFLAQAEVE